jgi:hypothetical protein
VNEQNISQADGKDGPEAIQEIPSQQKREESAMPTSTEGALQYDEKCVTLLPKVGIRA